MTQRQNLDDLKALLDAATPGPWRAVAVPNDCGDGWPVVKFRDWTIMSPPMHCDSLGSQRADAALITACPCAICGLISEVERLRAGISEAVSDLSAMEAVTRHRDSDVADAARAIRHALLDAKYPADPTAMEQG